MKNIVLIGFMGSGKSTVGELLAAKVGYPFVDTDDAVEELAGKSIKEIFEQDGEETFRAIERGVAQEVSLRTGQVVACGGGIVLDDENVRALKTSGILVYLRVTSKDACRRTEATVDRPLLNVTDRENEARKLLCAREEIYESIADIAVDTSELVPADVAAKVEAQLRQQGALR